MSKLSDLADAGYIEMRESVVGIDWDMPPAEAGQGVQVEFGERPDASGTRRSASPYDVGATYARYTDRGAPSVPTRYFRLATIARVRDLAWDASRGNWTFVGVDGERDELPFAIPRDTTPDRLSIELARKLAVDRVEVQS